MQLHVGEIDTTWTADNLIYRSSIWKDGKLLSAGYRKFFNWGEHEQLSPVPTDISTCELVEKIDGSCLIASTNMIRTRGTFDARMHENGYEVDTLIKRYPKAFDVPTDQTWLFEWVSPTHKIILNYGDLDMFLTGIVYHKDYSYARQFYLDEFAKVIGVKRPRTYHFGSMDEMLSAVRDLKGQEGLCVYSSNGQVIHKVKSAWYLALHRMKSELNNLDSIIDLWLSLGKPKYLDFYNHVVTTFDYELAEQCKGMLSRVCDASQVVADIYEGMLTFIGRLTGTRKDKALKIISAYGKTSRSGFVFTLLDGKGLGDDAIKKLLWQVIV